MHFFDPRVYDLLPRNRHRPALAAYLNLVAAQTHERPAMERTLAWVASKLSVAERTVRRYERLLAKAGLLVVRRGGRCFARIVRLSDEFFAKLPISKRRGRSCPVRPVARVRSESARIEGARARPRKQEEQESAPRTSEPEPEKASEPTFTPKPGLWRRLRDWNYAGKVGPKPTE